MHLRHDRTPRVVVFTAEQLAADAENIAPRWGCDRTGRTSARFRWLIPTDFPTWCSRFCCTASADHCASPLPEALRHAAKANPPSQLAAVPAMWRAWQEAKAIPPGVRLAISAGAPLSVDLEQAVFKSRGLKIHNFYGASECGGIAYDASESPRTDSTLVERRCKNVNLSLNDQGCLVVCSRAVAETFGRANWTRSAAEFFRRVIWRN